MESEMLPIVFRTAHRAQCTGDAINAVLAAAGYSLYLLLKWLSLLLSGFYPNIRVCGRD
jgi:hypothetical protein